MPTVDDLIFKIGLQTVEIDVLNNVIQKVTKERDDLQAVVTAKESDVEKKTPEKEAKK